MSFRLPPVNHPARELMGDVANVAAVLNPLNLALMKTTLEAKAAARKMFAADTTKAMRRVCFIVLRADSGERWLISIGRKEGWRKEWNFGNGNN